MRRLLLFACLLLVGCGTRAARVTIPANCMKVRITDFTKPCPTLPDGDLMCDGVRVHLNCVAVRK
jgi:hypothetical protein